jgi:hypothetical protein
MAYFRCEKHGGTGLRELCECLNHEIIQGLFPKTYELEGSVVICKSCAEFICKNCKPTNVTIELLDTFEGQIELSGESWSLFYTRHNATSVCWCGLCYWDFKVKQARHENRTLEVDVYEKTLEHQDQTIIDKLYEYLLNSYPFELKLYDDNYNYSYSLPNTKGIKALEVYQGHILTPLTISVWYVTEKKEQELVLSIIKDFFKQEEKYQRRIVFYEAETPRIEVENKEYEYYYTTKEDEVILLDVLVR